MGCGEGLARILVFITNFAFVLVGIVLLVIGILYKLDVTSITDAVPDDYSGLEHVPTLCITIGAVTFFIAFLGCCGACKKNTCMLNTYGAILIIIFILQVALGIYALVKIKDNDDLKQHVTKELQRLLKKDPETLENIQSELHCCGVDRPSDWGINIPSSCYDDGKTQPWERGCAEVVFDLLMSTAKIIGIVIISVSAVEVVGAMLALCMAHCIKERRRTY